MGTSTRTSYSLSEELGAELVTDGGFAAVTETNRYTSNFSVDANGWFNNVGDAVAGNIDNIGGLNDNLRYTASNGNLTEHFGYNPGNNGFFVVGTCVRVRFDYYIPSGQSNIDGVAGHDNIAGVLHPVGTTTDAWTSIDFYFNVSSNAFRLYAYDGVDTTFQDVGADDVFYIRNFRIEAVTLTSWTAGTGWAPQAIAAALTGKAKKVAGTASNLTQTATAAEAGKVYRVGNIAVRTAGTLTPEFGSTDGAVISANGTYYDYLVAADTDYLKFKADATFAGTIDAVSCKETFRRGTPD